MTKARYSALRQHWIAGGSSHCLSKATGKAVVYDQISLEAFKISLPIESDIFVEGISYQEQFGYFGPDSENLVAWAAENARGGRLSTLEEYLEVHPLQLT